MQNQPTPTTNNYTINGNNNNNSDCSDSENDNNIIMGLYVEKNEQRKTSISFDKIKQISLAHSPESVETISKSVTYNDAEQISNSDLKEQIQHSAAAAAIAEKAPPRCPLAQRHVKLRNLVTGEHLVDSLNASNSALPASCTAKRCLGALLDPHVGERSVARTPAEILTQAIDFVGQYYASIKRTDSVAHKARLAEIESQVQATGTYYLKETELIYGAKLAWRNAARCIGRIQWSKLQVFDARFTSSADEMFEALCNHIKYATNKGQLRSAITIMPPRVKTANNDWRIWNGQLISYAGYRNKETGEIIGDPANVDITDVCQRLGWQGKGTRFDILPLVLSAAGGPPKLYTLPDDLVMRVKITHPKYDWFESLALEWYAVPAVANMMLDVGGLQFTAAPFNGWYMVTEIGTRDLGDPHRYNILESVAQGLGLNTKTNASLWKDFAIVELNIAVLESYRAAGVTIVDHHTAVETFMTHISNEQRLRGGCPADWVWLVPPTSGSTTAIFHQEVANYHLLPNYEYMEPVWRNYDWKAYEEAEARARAMRQAARDALSSGSKAATPVASRLAQLAAATTPEAMGNLRAFASPSGKSPNELTPRKLRFKEIARAVKFTSKLFGKALARRIKATILYATETGKSERFANKLAQTFSQAFNVHLMSMNDYDMTCLEHEALLLIVTSTFGNGDPPENGEPFAKHLAAVKLTGDTSPDIESINSVQSNPFFQMLSSRDDGKSAGGIDYDLPDNNNNNYDGHTRRSSASSSTTEGADEFDADLQEDSGPPGDEAQVAGWSGEQARAAFANKQQQRDDDQSLIRPLANVRFGVFALGSTAYPHFCAFGRYVDQTLGELGAERIVKCACGDELCGQEKAFSEWSSLVFKKACEVFCISDSVNAMEQRPEVKWSPRDVKFVPVELVDGLSNNNGNGNRQESIWQRPSTNTSNKDVNELLSRKQTVVNNFVSVTNKKILAFRLKRRWDLHVYTEAENLQTICVDLEPDKSLTFEAGDHVAIYPTNTPDKVDGIIERMSEAFKQNQSNQQKDETQSASLFNFDQVYTILVKRENLDLTPSAPSAQTACGAKALEENWIQHDRIPVTSIREALIRYLDITSPPSQDFLSTLANQCNDPDERKRLQQLARNFTVYEDWKTKNEPHLLTVLEEFKAIQFEPALVTQLPIMKPRFYSISSVNVGLTVGVVRFTTSRGERREGLCSNYLLKVPLNTENVFGYIRSAPAFHMPQDKKIPLIFIGAGTGIAPFRSFWQQRYVDIEREKSRHLPSIVKSGQTQVSISDYFGRIELYFGCRNSNYILFKDELDEMLDCCVLSGVHIGFSRPLDCDVIKEDMNEETRDDETTKPKSNILRSKIAKIRQAKKRVYVQDMIAENKNDIYKLIQLDGAHIYVCGDVAMADGVYKTLVSIFNTQILLDLRSLNRYHEDIFGAKNS